jgi:hypothetical protein
MYTAFTHEIDDPEIAATEISEQLKDKKLLKNSVGIIACYFECFETGIIEAICKALPFDIIGCTVMGSADNSGGSMQQLNLTVLTSDSCTFSTALSDVITTDNIRQPLENVWKEAETKLGQKPSLVFALGPIMKDVSGDEMVKTLDTLGNGVPLFGTLSNDTGLLYETSFVCHNSGGTFPSSFQKHLYKFALLMIHGDVKPRFYTTSISRKNIQRQFGIVTESEGYTIKKINNLTLHEYFVSIGIPNARIKAITMLPVLLNFDDGTEPVAYSMYAISEAGAFCGCIVPVGCRITFADIDRNSVMETAEIAVKAALADAEKNGANGIIAIPCFTRSLVISPNSEDEIKQTLALVEDKFPFSLIYSGGEICPVYKHGSEEFVNRFHNLTYTLMVF